MRLLLLLVVLHGAASPVVQAATGAHPALYSAEVPAPGLSSQPPAHAMHTLFVS